MLYLSKSYHATEVIYLVSQIKGNRTNVKSWITFFFPRTLTSITDRHLSSAVQCQTGKEQRLVFVLILCECLPCKSVSIEILRKIIKSNYIFVKEQPKQKGWMDIIIILLVLVSHSMQKCHYQVFKSSSIYRRCSGNYL